RCWTPCGGCQTGCDCLLELGWLKCVSGSRALQVTSSGKAGLSEIFHIEISDEGVLSRRLYAPAPRDLFLSTTREGRRPDVVRAGNIRHLPALGFVCRSHLEGSQPGRTSSAGAGQI